MKRSILLLALACFPFVAASAQRDRSCISFRAASFCEEPLVHIAVISSTVAIAEKTKADAMKLFDERK